MLPRDLVSVGEALTVAPVAEADSFVLHAPLEFIARTELMALVSPAQQVPTQKRIAQIAIDWKAAGAALDLPNTSGIEDPRSSLAAALAAGDLDAVDRSFVALCLSRSQPEIVADLADLAIRYLGGAAHAPIFLELLPRLGPTDFSAALMGRALVRDIARHPDWAIKWIDEPRALATTTTATLTERLISPQAGRAATSTSIYPTMSLVDEIGLAHECLSDVTLGLTVNDARRQLLRIAAMSMIQDDPQHAPYGWSHCLTMPQAVLAIADQTSDPQLAIDVAATYVLGFRATLSSGPINENWVPQANLVRQSANIVTLEPAVAAATAWRAFAADRGLIVQQLVDHAAPHEDAHLAKYTLACLDAIEADPQYTHVYLAAAAYLAAWWHHHG